MKINIPCIYADKFGKCSHPKINKILGVFKRNCVWLWDGHCNLLEIPKRPPAPPSPPAPPIFKEAIGLLKTAKKITKAL